MEPIPGQKHQPSFENGPPAKRFKPSHESPEQYSDAVRKKLQSTTRTGQACDRCKERKMKCDTNPTACGPCAQKNLPCVTTDRVTRKSSERGQAERLEHELRELRKHLMMYNHKYGALNEGDLVSESLDAKEAYTDHAHSQLNGHVRNPTASIHDSVEALYTGPINGTSVDILDEELDVANFKCPDMEDYDKEHFGVFNTSKTSVLNTICGAQSVKEPRLPTKDEALDYVRYFLTYIWPFVPIVHRSSFVELTNRYYNNDTSVTTSERVTIVIVLAIIAQQRAVRNPKDDYLMESSHRWLHYGLSFYRDLLHDRSLPSMQAVTLILTHLRNLPKPGYSWSFSHKVLVRAIDLNYHRDPDAIVLPEAENNVLAKELRKRVFWSILGICVTTGTKVGKPAPWHFQHLDVPLPMAIQDHEVSVDGLVPQRSGKCDFWAAIHLFLLLPLLTDLYNHIISVRRPGIDYARCVEMLDAKITAWRAGWDRDVAVEVNDDQLRVATLHIETWAAEYQLTLHHPRLNTMISPGNASEKSLDICHKHAKRLLNAFREMSGRHRGADFTWHSLVGYVLAFALTLHIYRRRAAKLPQEKIDAMKAEFSNWMHVMGTADLVLKTDRYLIKTFETRVRKVEAGYQNVASGHATANGYQHSPKNEINSPPEAESEGTARTQSISQTSAYAATPTIDQLSYRNPNPTAPPTYHAPQSHPQTHPPMYPAPYQYAPQPVASPIGTAPPPSYPPYSTAPHAQAQSQQPHPHTHQLSSHLLPHPPIPTSLAPLLNEQVYVTFQPPPAPIPGQHLPPQQNGYLEYANTVNAGWGDYAVDGTSMPLTYWPLSINTTVYQGQQ